MDQPITVLDFVITSLIPRFPYSLYVGEQKTPECQFTFTHFDSVEFTRRHPSLVFRDGMSDPQE